ncbi:Transcription factor bHLH90 [Striga hermonthica]|uniref:Transcription factor bHLH90 n=1 Tax=Striga hermonthica TaxID=68872 RepID=A0A9N7R166_STRHE|nr:Transcription factor bHLH90 [Striga hermonthica]
MAALETAMELLRPLVNTKPWDYCVIWKLGDDPSRFIEWGACCCGHVNEPEDDIELEARWGGECRDKLIKHPIRAKACQRLARLPSAFSLYSGVHGDVVISKQTRWSVHSNLSASDDEPNGTQVLIPVACGLIELFSTEHVPKDQKIIDYVSSRFRAPLKQENTNQKTHFSFNLKEELFNSLPKDYLQNWLPPLHYTNFPPQLPQPSNYSSFEGSPTCSSLSNEHQLVKVGPAHKLPDMVHEKATNEYVDSPRSNLRLKRKKCMTVGKENDCVEITHKGEKGVYKSKNLMTERNRRKRIKDGMFALRALVPKISKMDRVSTLGDAAEYIKELQETIDGYQDELQAMEENECKNSIAKPNPTKSIKECSEKKAAIEARVEVNQLGNKEFLVKVVSMQKRGGFSRLIEALDSLGLWITDANVATFNGAVLNVLKVEAGRMEVEPSTLKYSLYQLVS